MQPTDMLMISMYQGSLSQALGAIPGLFGMYGGAMVFTPISYLCPNLDVCGTALIVSSYFALKGIPSASDVLSNTLLG